LERRACRAVLEAPEDPAQPAGRAAASHLTLPRVVEKAVLLKTQVLIIGGGVTGAGLARDLALRGLECIVVEKQDINAGASGGNHGLLHSGARYVESDPATARECRDEGELLKRLAPHCIEDTGGLFVAVKGDDENFIADFPRACAENGIRAEGLDLDLARRLEPALGDQVIAAYAVPDATIDPFKLSLDNVSHAQHLGTRLMRFTRVVSFSVQNGRVVWVGLMNTETGQEVRIEADLIVNASGAWAGQVAALAGIKIDMLYSKGSMLVTQRRLTHRVINRLRKATDGDILVPGGTVSVLGTTSVRVESPDTIYPELDEIDQVIEEGARMIPELKTTHYIRAYCGVRPLMHAKDEASDRDLSRGFVLIDHASQGIANFITITGGKLTTYRLMAEKTADLICERLGVRQSGRTRTEPLPPAEINQWTRPGQAPRAWIERNRPEDLLLCECEMVPQSVIDGIASSLRDRQGAVTLKAIGLRSRVGRGPCQGMFCSLLIAAYLYDRGAFSGEQGLVDLREFLGERWRGLRPVLWDMPLVKAELQEAMHCGLFGLELIPGHNGGHGP
jgi:glycerol-3-phosphate dehydrogenase